MIKSTKINCFWNMQKVLSEIFVFWDLKSKLIKQIALKPLIERNRNPKPVTELIDSKSRFIKLPFIMINTDKTTQTDFTISNDRYLFLKKIYFYFIKN